MELLPTVAGGGYLANVQPSEFSRRYEQQLPESLPGAAFLQQYGSHWDGATTIDAAQVRHGRVLLLCSLASSQCLGADPFPHLPAS